MSLRPALLLLAVPWFALACTDEGEGKADTGETTADAGDDSEGGEAGDGGESGDDGGMGDDGGETGDDGGMGDGGETGDDGGADDGGEGGEDDGGEAGDDGEEPPPVPLPEEGAWTLASTTLVRDDCNVAAFADPADFVPDSYVIAHTGTDTFTMAAGGEDPGGCENTGGYDFSCDSAVVRQDLGDFGFDAEMVIDNQLSGTIGEGLVSMEGTNELSITCDGDCFLIELVLSFPCAVELDMRLEY